MGIVSRPPWIGHRKYIGASTDGGVGQPAAYRLAVGSQVRFDAVALLCPAPGQAKSGNDLVEHQQGAMLVGQLAERRQKALSRPDTPLQRLDDHGRYLAAVRGHDVRGGLCVVEGADQDVPGNLAGEAS